MKSARSLILLFASSLVLHASAFHIGGLGDSELEKSAERTQENSIGVEPRKLGLDLPENIQRRRENGTGLLVRSIEKRQSFVKCIFELRGRDKPKYSCDHSRDVIIKWHEEKDRLMGTFTTNFHCPEQRSFANEMQSVDDKAVQQLKQLIREKRRAVYRNDPDEEEETAHLVGNRQAPEEETVEESQVAEPPEAGGEEEVAAAEEKDPPAAEVENEEKGQNEVNEDDTASPEGSTEDKEIPEAGEPEKEVSKEDEAADAIDTEVPAAEAGQGGTVDPPTTEDKNDTDTFDVIHTVIEIDLTDLIPVDAIGEFLSNVGTIIYDAGDYILSLILGRMKRRLQAARINERFDASVEKLAKLHGGDSAKALKTMEKRIHQQLGKSYEFEIVKFLKELRDGMQL